MAHQEMKTYVMPADSIGAVAACVYIDIFYKGKQNSDTHIGYLDNVKSGDFYGLPIFKPETINKDSRIIIASRRHEKRFVKQLSELGFSNIINAKEFMTPDNSLLHVNRLQSEEIEKTNLSVEDKIKGFFIDFGNDEDTYTMGFVNFVVTTRCTLNCRDCASLMSFFNNHTDIGVESIISSVDAFFNYVDFVDVLNITGGEPFAYKHLYSVLCKLNDFRNRIGCFTIITNATVVPNDDVIHAMKKADITVSISDYGDLSVNKNALVSRLSEMDVKYKVFPIEQWYKQRSFSKKISNPQTMFHDCATICPVIINGRLYYCQFAGFGDILRGFPEKTENFIDLISPNTSKKALISYIERSNALPACAYCTGITYADTPIPPAIQASSPLPYKQYE
jgi:hypothetical protein